MKYDRRNLTSFAAAPPLPPSAAATGVRGGLAAAPLPPPPLPTTTASTTTGMPGAGRLAGAFLLRFTGPSATANGPMARNGLTSNGPTTAATGEKRGLPVTASTASNSLAAPTDRGLAASPAVTPLPPSAGAVLDGADAAVIQPPPTPTPKEPEAATTGLVTLSVHEALTFDGVEIAIHPDLFSDGGVGGNDGGNDGASVTVVATPGSTTTAATAPTTLGRSGGAGGGGVGAVSSSSGNAGGGVAASMSAPPRRSLAVGDLVEVRVWDAKPGRGGGGVGHRHPQHLAAARRRSTHSATTVGGTSLLHGAAKPPTANGGPSSSSSSLHPPPQLSQPPLISVHSRQPSTASVLSMGSYATAATGTTSSGGSGASGSLIGENLLSGPGAVSPPVPGGVGGGAREASSSLPTATGAHETVAKAAETLALAARSVDDSNAATTEDDGRTSASASIATASGTGGDDGTITPVAGHSRESSMSQPPPSALLPPTTSASSSVPPTPQKLLPMRRDSGTTAAAASTTTTPGGGAGGSRDIITPQLSESATSSVSSSPAAAAAAAERRPPIPPPPPLASGPRSRTASASDPAFSPMTTASAAGSSSSNVDAPAPPPASSFASAAAPPLSSNTVAPPPVRRNRTFTLPSSLSARPNQPPAGLDAANRAAQERRAATASPNALAQWARSAAAAPHGQGIIGLPRGHDAASLSLMGSGSTEEYNDLHHHHQTAAEDVLERIATTHDLRTSFIMLVTERTLSSIKSGARTQVSILRQVADLYNCTSYDMVTVTQIEKCDEANVMASVSADFVTVTIKDQFVSRGEMYHFQKSFVRSWIYEGQRLNSNGIRANAKLIRHGNRAARSGVVTSDSKLTFRSRSARIIWLVQISSEMWDYACPYDVEGVGADRHDEDTSCDIYFDKFISFMHRLFHKWKTLEVTHSLTVVFFSRTYVRNGFTGLDQSPSFLPMHIDVDGRHFEDHYKMLIENETRIDWEYLVFRIKKEFISYPKEVGWGTSHDSNRIPSTAAQGNLLEAINNSLNLLHHHYMDRDLQRTGNSIVIITPGCGVFEVNKDLAGITKQRMMDNGIGSDMLSLGLPPLHVAPFFLYKEASNVHADEIHGFDVWKTYFEVPHWMNLSFVSYDEHGKEPILYADRFRANESSDGKWSPQSRSSMQVAPNGFIVNLSSPLGQSPAPQVSLLKPDADLSTSPAFESSQTMDVSKTHAHQHHLISGREFEDILEACRPRNRGEDFACLPSALTSLLNQTKPNSMPQSRKDRCTTMNGSELLSSDTKGTVRKDSQSSSEERTEPNRPSESLQVRKKHSSVDHVHLREWGAVNFDDMCVGRNLQSRLASYHTMTDSGHVPSALVSSRDRSGSGSDKSAPASPSSSFASNYSFLLGRSPDGFGGSYLCGPTFLHPLVVPQRSLSFEMSAHSPASGGGDTDMAIARSKGNHSDNSLSTMVVDDHSTAEKHSLAIKSKVLSALSNSSMSSLKERTQKNSASSLRDFMSEYDSHVFMPLPKEEKKSAADATAHVNVSHYNNMIESPHGQATTHPRRLGSHHNIPAHGHSHSSGVLAQGGSGISQQVGGIGAALVQFNSTGVPISSHHESRDTKRALSSSRITGHDKRTYLSESYGGMALTGHVRDEVGSRHISPSPITVGMPLGSDPPEILRPKPVTAAGSSLAPFKGIVFPDTVSRSYSKRGILPSSAGHLYPVAPLETALTSRHQVGVPCKPGHAMKQPLVAPDGSATHLVKSHALSPPQLGDLSPVKKSSHHHKHGHKSKGKKHHRKGQHHLSKPSGPSPHHPRRKPWVLNPFRQQDEEEVLAKRTHNRRRWSHVFPLGEEEFKRHAGPNWKSLCQPAILPITIDFHPSPQELNERYQFKSYSVTLDAMDQTYYSSHAELLDELVTQRLIQDFQLVPQSAIDQSTEKKVKFLSKRHSMPRSLAGTNVLLNDRNPTIIPARPLLSLPSVDNSLQTTLSMGHKIQVLSYNPTSDSVDVLQYYASFAQNDSSNTQTYHYLLWSPLKQKFLQVVQNFSKYSNQYKWNEVDNIICGDPDKTLSEGTRYRRVNCAIIPDAFSDTAQEKEYAGKFRRLVEYLSKLQRKENQGNMNIKITTSGDALPNGDGNKSKTKRRYAPTNMKRFIVDLRKGKRDKYEWMEVEIDSSCDTKKIFHITLKWLVASAAKVEAQVHLLQRRCTQYGLKLVAVPQVAFSDNIFLNPFTAPVRAQVRSKGKATVIESALKERFHFIDDGEYMTDPNDMDDIDEYDFPVNKWFGKVMKQVRSRQYLHRSGTLFVRTLKDEKGWAIFVLFGNMRHIDGDDTLFQTAKKLYVAVDQFITEVLRSEFEINENGSELNDAILGIEQS